MYSTTISCLAVIYKGVGGIFAGEAAYKAQEGFRGVWPLLTLHTQSDLQILVYYSNLVDLFVLVVLVVLVLLPATFEMHAR